VGATKPAQTRSRPIGSPLQKPFLILAGCWAGLSLLKFGNPVILDRLVDAPANSAEFIFTAWPVSWGIALFSLVLLVGLIVAQFRKPNHWMLYLPAIWLFWQFLSSTHTIDPQSTKATLTHFSVCVACFYVGIYALGPARSLRTFFIPMGVAFVWLLWMGLDQHYGGLEATRKNFYDQPNWQSFPPEYIKKVQSDRIFSTLCYPNTLAGALMLFGPVLGFFLLQWSAKWPRVARGVIVGLLAYISVACFFWTGSKGGWLIAIIMACVYALGSPRLSRKLRVGIVAVIIALGVAGFLVKFSGYLKRGAPSASARLIYWTGAFETARENPLLGTGPGSFAAAFRKIKPPEAEMARLVHNDYLEQASDSGIPGFLAYATFICGSLWLLRSKIPRDNHELNLLFLGLLAWALQSFIEFNLYIPAMSWPVFLFLGWFWAQPNRIDNPSADPVPSRG
jgi:O-antigen ligase